VLVMAAKLVAPAPSMKMEASGNSPGTAKSIVVPNRRGYFYWAAYGLYWNFYPL